MGFASYWYKCPGALGLSVLAFSSYTSQQTPVSPGRKGREAQTCSLFLGDQSQKVLTETRQQDLAAERAGGVQNGEVVALVTVSGMSATGLPSFVLKSALSAEILKFLFPFCLLPVPPCKKISEKNFLGVTVFI